MAQIESLVFRDNHVRVKLDDGESLALPYEVYTQYKLSSGMDLERNAYLELKDESELFGCMQKAYNYLASGNRSSEEVRRYLRRKKFQDMAVEKTVNFLTEKGYIDDYRFARAFTEGRIRQVKWGKDLIVRDLYLKGVNRRIIDRVIRDTGADSPDPEALYELALKKYNSVKDKNDSINKVGNYLRGRGFGYDAIRKVLDRIERDIS